MRFVLGVWQSPSYPPKPAPPKANPESSPEVRVLMGVASSNSITVGVHPSEIGTRGGGERGEPSAELRPVPVAAIKPVSPQDGSPERCLRSSNLRLSGFAGRP